MPVYPGLTQNTIDGRARAAALHSLLQIQDEAIDVVHYRSTGHVAIITDDPSTAFEIAAKLHPDCQCTIFNTGEKIKQSEILRDDGVLDITPATISGHLGAFNITVNTGQDEVSLGNLIELPENEFDLVLDITSTPYIDSALPPPGYFATGSDSAELQKALQQIPELIGEFEKPRYFSYKPYICVHGNSGLSGCNNCIEACPADAIQSLKDRIEVSPYLCQGEGICTTVCPTGALTFTAPRTSDLLDRIRQVLRIYLTEGGANPFLLFHDTGTGRQRAVKLSSRLPENIIPLQIESSGASGPDVWLSCLAYGASAIVILTTDQVRDSVKSKLQHQVEITQALLKGMGHSADHLRLIAESVGDSAIIDDLGNPSESILQCSATFATANEKRNTLRMALDHLNTHATDVSAEIQPLPKGAPFGEVMVNREACTLCMACTSVCPTSALIDGKDTPRLSFIEWNCTQCGLCETACPEDAISLSARFVYNTEQREKRRTLNEEAPYCCIRCGKPFATQSMIGKMTEKLRGHRMFQGEQALNRLKMCEDCRVIDIYTDNSTVK